MTCEVYLGPRSAFPEGSKGQGLPPTGWRPWAVRCPKICWKEAVKLSLFCKAVCSGVCRLEQGMCKETVKPSKILREKLKSPQNWT